jgi:hypothetical protein
LIDKLTSTRIGTRIGSRIGTRTSTQISHPIAAIAGQVRAPTT